MTHERLMELKIRNSSLKNPSVKAVSECLDEIERLQEVLSHYKNNPPPHPGANWADITTDECLAGGYVMGLSCRDGIALDEFDRKMLMTAGKCISRIINQFDLEKMKVLPESTCPICGYMFDAASHPIDENATPKPGDLSLCLKCGELMVFKADMTLVQAGFKDVMDLKTKEFMLLSRTQKLIREKRPLG